MKPDTRRDQLIDQVQRELIGPDPLTDAGPIQENGEEILIGDSPSMRYAAGILHPQNSRRDPDDEGAVQDEGGLPDVANEEDNDDLLRLSNAFRQSAMSLTVLLEVGSRVSVNISAGQYRQKSETIGAKDVKGYFRTSIQWTAGDGDEWLELPSAREPEISLSVPDSDLKLFIRHRYDLDAQNCSAYNFALVNSRVADQAFSTYSECYYQAALSVRTESGFKPFPTRAGITDDPDRQSNELLYRDVHSFGTGHGCSADWDEEDGKVYEVRTTFLPSYEMRPIVPNNDVAGARLDMKAMTALSDIEATCGDLEVLTEAYAAWIAARQSEIANLPEQHRPTAVRHMESAARCLTRMRSGVQLLREDERVQQAFALMNEAMLLQQLHYSLPLRKWSSGEGGGPPVLEALDMPDIHREDTWFNNENRTYGKWRPFQIAFILMNLRSMHDAASPDRSIVDLIWFPTGGGKTEAYLGLSAYTIFLRRIKQEPDEGVTVLMRYTLRLLTAQQYERAAALICACEHLRRRCPELLGNKRIRIGLWVGQSTTPNNRDSAVRDLRALVDKPGSAKNPFIILKCPWCGAQMGPVSGSGLKRVFGYKKVGRPARFVFECSNSECDFSSHPNHLPLEIVDEELYEDPPALLLGTVDKFAMLPYTLEASRMFGLQDGVRMSSPDLIIQDELHLISGPLGSMVAHYETLINELCASSPQGGRPISEPKIVASTATISRAVEQCVQLYACKPGDVSMFPSPGLLYSDSFFAREAKDTPGRRYVGVFAPGVSQATASIRLYAALLYSAAVIDASDERDRDAYWTNVGYYNSIRELGQAATWVDADVLETVNRLHDRYRDSSFMTVRAPATRGIQSLELTSRIPGDEISANLQKLSQSYPPAGQAVDICLASNMISVGLDISRLGLMTVAGQPKTTAEYIQATSRVGRNPQKDPGLVFVLYNPTRPRDKSHFEQFIPYHSQIYTHVEPTSVTAFSLPVRKKALHAVLIGYLRFLTSGQDSGTPRAPTESEVSRFREVLIKRVGQVDPGELDATLLAVSRIVDKWERDQPAIFKDFQWGQEPPLMYPPGRVPPQGWQGVGFETPTSMRNVDTTSEVQLLQRFREIE